LNEGITTYLERRIVEALYGVDRRAMEDSLGMQSLRQDIGELAGKGDGALTRLRVDLRNRDPDDGFSDVAYEKGRFFIGFLESRLGRERLDNFLRQYFSQFAFQSVTTEQFLDCLQAKVLSQPDANVTLADVLAWLDQPGLPSTVVEPHSNAFSAVDKERADWLNGARPAPELATEKWATQQWVHFLDNMPPSITSKQLAQLDAAFKFTQATNSEIAHSWLLVATRAGYAPADARLETFLTTIGRRRLVKDLYEALVKTPQGKQRAQAIYAKARPLYQVPLAEQLDKIMGVRG
jgi:aminopeptidase N